MADGCAKALTDAVKKAGGDVVDTAPPTRARERGGWFEEQVIAAGLRLDRQALDCWRRGWARTRDGCRGSSRRSPRRTATRAT